MNPEPRVRRIVLAALVLGLGLTGLGSLCGCLVAGYSSGEGFYLWPGSIVITLLLLLFFFLRRGR